MRARRPWPRSLRGQLLLALTIVLVVSQAAAMLIVVGVDTVSLRATQNDRVLRRSVRDLLSLPDPLPSALPFAVPDGPGPGVSFLSANDRADLLPDAEPQPRLERRLTSVLSAEGVTLGARGLRVVRHWPRPPRNGEAPPLRRPPDAPLFDPPGPPLIGPLGPGTAGIQEVVVSVNLAPGVWYNHFGPYQPIGPLATRLSVALATALAIALALFWLLSRHIVGPLRALAMAADRLGRGDPSAPVEFHGPDEVRAAGAAFTRMRARIARLLDTQSAMLGGISHDLRRPLARLRMRSETVADPERRARIEADIAEMDRMIDAILRAARDLSPDEPLVATDMGALAEAVADDAADMGNDVGVTVPQTRVVLQCRRDALRRAVANLLDNAVHHAGAGHVTLREREDAIEIVVEDDGPGIPEDRMAEMTEPFARLERPGAPEGSGLGLAIARAAAEAHGGTLTLSNRAEGGLRATLSLPR